MHNNFFIAFFERSGSTMLVDLLNQHPQIDCRMEIFDTKDIRVKNKHQQIRQLDKTQVKDELSFFKKTRLLSKAKIRGFKFKYPNQIDNYLDVYTHLIENEFKCIFLRRKNLLKAAVSHQYHKNIRKKTGLSNIKQKIDIEIEGLNTLNAINYMEMRDRQNKRFQQKLPLDFKKIHTVYYEDILNDKQKVLKDIFQFLEIKSQIVQPSKFIKIVDNNLKSALHNYDWVRQILAHTPYVNYFYKDEISAEDLKATQHQLIQFYEGLEIELPPALNKNTYYHQLQKALNLTDHEVYIFRKLGQFYYNKLNWLRNPKSKATHAKYKTSIFKKIKQLEIKLFLGDEKYRLKRAFDKV